MKLTKFQFKEFSKLWFDLSKITFASLILKFLEPQAPHLELKSILTIILGLTASIIFVILGLRFSKEVKEK